MPTAVGKLFVFIKTYYLYILLSLLFIFLIAAGIFLGSKYGLFTKRPQEYFGVIIRKPDKKDEVKSTSGPIIHLPAGSQTYKFSNGKDVLGPKVSSLTINPFTPTKEDDQKVSLNAFYETNITDVAIEVITDSTTQKQTLSLASGSQTNGTWEGSWKITDSYDYTYGFRLILKSDKDIYDNIIWFRHK